MGERGKGRANLSVAHKPFTANGASWWALMRARRSWMRRQFMKCSRWNMTHSTFNDMHNVAQRDTQHTPNRGWLQRK